MLFYLDHRHPRHCQDARHGCKASDPLGCVVNSKLIKVAAITDMAKRCNVYSREQFLQELSREKGSIIVPDPSRRAYIRSKEIFYSGRRKSRRNDPEIAEQRRSNGGV